MRPFARLIEHARSAASLLIALLLVLLFVVACAPTEPERAEEAGEAGAAAGPPPGAPDFTARPPDPETRGLTVKTERVADGYLLFTPLVSDTTYLLDNDGQAVHTWKSTYSPGSAVYLLDDGHLLRNGRDPNLENFRAGGTGGIFQKLSWDGELVWEWKMSTEESVQHHDVEPLPNGNILALGWEVKSPKESARAGREAEQIPEKGLWPDYVVEIEPLPPDAARIVWEWHVWDHLVQNVDPEANNFGEPAEHPGRLDVNAAGRRRAVDPEEFERLKALGYVPEDAEPEELQSDFLHINAVDYNAALDQIALSVPETGEVWIIDHGISTEEAAGPAGDILYRWGNPRIYGRGESSEQRLFYQHDVLWIPDGLPGAGHLTILNNGGGRPDGSYSTVVEIATGVTDDGRYPLGGDVPWGPAAPVWTYEERETFYAPFISGAQRLANGNTLICSGPNGRFLEVDPNGEIVWEYWNPFEGDVRMADGTLPQPGIDRYPYAVFRVTRIAPDHPALVGRELSPLDPQPPIRPGEEE
jgi:hypothetical protein